MGLGLIEAHNLLLTIKNPHLTQQSKINLPTISFSLYSNYLYKSDNHDVKEQQHDAAMKGGTLQLEIYLHSAAYMSQFSVRILRTDMLKMNFCFFNVSIMVRDITLIKWLGPTCIKFLHGQSNCLLRQNVTEPSKRKLLKIDKGTFRRKLFYLPTLSSTHSIPQILFCSIGHGISNTDQMSQALHDSDTIVNI